MTPGEYLFTALLIEGGYYPSLAPPSSCDAGRNTRAGNTARQFRRRR